MLDIVPIEKPGWVSGDADAMAREIKAIPEQVQKRPEASYRKYQAEADHSQMTTGIANGDLFWVFLREKRFPIETYKQLEDRKIGPCRINYLISNNAYQVKFPSHAEFEHRNFVDLMPYAGDASAAKSFNVELECMTETRGRVLPSWGRLIKIQMLIT